MNFCHQLKFILTVVKPAPYLGDQLFCFVRRVYGV